MKTNRSITFCIVVAGICVTSFSGRLVGAEPLQPSNKIGEGKFKHAVATVNLPGFWEKIQSGNAGDKDLRIKSKDGQEVLISVDVPADEVAPGQLERVAEVVLEGRMRALQMLAENTAEFGPPETTRTRGSVTTTTRGYSKDKKTRTAVRVEATSKRIRTSILFDGDSKGADEFAAWARTVFDGVK